MIYEVLNAAHGTKDSILYETGKQPELVIIVNEQCRQKIMEHAEFTLHTESVYLHSSLDGFRIVVDKEQKEYYRIARYL